ncbi:hypothetical protein GSI_00128 [Ganoderma sinense ZZ0214-1]|uniref:Uncharacterized protein n=1 Tax=Ganoderma sinense ZZ0214-1 TaxID=1077348 RepID=A0A2G8SRP5_9APHY|nr:hypothetical protein GSI_00128 [Ganoderma sinense ZZ0214-1]
MADKKQNPALWEGSQYLLEMEPSTDPAKPGYRYTEAAALAQVRKWKRLMRNRGPETTIPPEMLSNGKNRPPVLLYGWPFKPDHLVEYAKRHRISFETDPKHQEWLGCSTLEFNFADVTEDHYKKKNIVNYLRPKANMVVLNKLLRETGQGLEIGRPFSFKYPKILYMWTNYNMDEEYDDFGRPDRYDKLIGFLNTVMNECLPEGEKSELQWWWSWDDNDVNVLQDMD